MVFGPSMMHHGNTGLGRGSNRVWILFSGVQVSIISPSSPRFEAHDPEPTPFTQKRTGVSLSRRHINTILRQASWLYSLRTNTNSGGLFICEQTNSKKKQHPGNMTAFGRYMERASWRFALCVVWVLIPATRVVRGVQSELSRIPHLIGQLIYYREGGQRGVVVSSNYPC